MFNSTALEEAFSPVLDILVARIAATVRHELKAAAPSASAADRSMTKAEVAQMLGLTEQTLMAKIQTGTVPPPYTARGEQPRWSSKTIEKYMSGEWGSTK